MSDTKKTTLASAICRSFIPYLQTPASQGPKIKPAVRDSAPGEQAAPFLFLDSSSPLAVILPASLHLGTQN